MKGTDRYIHPRQMSPDRLRLLGLVRVRCLCKVTSPAGHLHAERTWLDGVGQGQRYQEE